MRPEYLGTFHAQAPKIAHNGCPFLNSVNDHETCKRLAEEFGYQLQGRHLANVWLYVKHSVQPHRDSSGKCLIYLHRGLGNLYVIDKGKLTWIRMAQGQVYQFNDRQTHLWMSDTPCTLLVANVRSKR